MYQRLFIGNKMVSLDEVDSTNTYIKELVSSNDREIEGLVVVTKNQLKGRGQKGSFWKSEKGKNLTFSIFFKPNIKVEDQFVISKLVSLAVVDFLDNWRLNNLKVKWPNDILCNNRKIAGILIENSIRGDKIHHTIVGVGLNVNQIKFDLTNNPTSMFNELGGELLDLEKLLNELLFFIEKRYLGLKTGKIDLIDKEYLEHLYWMNQSKKFLIDNQKVEGIITGVHSTGKLQVKIHNELLLFDLKDIEFLV